MQTLHASRFSDGLKRLAMPCLILVTVALGGCKSFLDPSEVGRFEPEQDPLVLPILDQLLPGTDDAEAEFYGATDVRAEDLVHVPREYVIQAGDVVSVQVEDLTQAGVVTTMSRIVDDRGMVRLQYLEEPVQAAGLTEAELQRAIIDAYAAAGQLQQAGVTVTVEQYNGRTFSMVGSFNAPNRYTLYRPDLRLLDALVLGRGVPQGVETVYVVRQQPQSQQQSGADAAQQQPATRQQRTQPQQRPADPLAPQPAGQQRPQQPEQPEQPQQGERFRFNPPAEPTNTRVIRIPLDALQRGELKYNIVVQANDMIIAPTPRIGIYYMGGHVSAPGPYQILPGNRVTLKQAVIAARMLDELAIPAKTDVIRKVGENQEIWVSVDLEQIFSGQQPDFYLRPNDQVMVGTNAIAPFLAAARNAFRLTYGAGFVYDRNFYDDDDDDN